MVALIDLGILLNIKTVLLLIFVPDKWLDKPMPKPKYRRRRRWFEEDDDWTGLTWHGGEKRKALLLLVANN